MTDAIKHYQGPLGVAAYDAMYQGSLHGDAEFYVACAQAAGQSVLECGAGTGRITRFFAAAGLGVTAVDISPAMLAAAKVNAVDDSDKDRITWVQADMRTLDLGRTFDSVIVPARTFMHVITPGDQRAALTALRRHLTPGGHLVLDLFDPNIELMNAPIKPEKELIEATHPLTGARLRRRVTSRTYDFLTQIVHETHRIEELDDAGTPTRTEDTSWSLRWSHRQELRYLLELTGFEVMAEYSSFDRDPPAYAKEQLWLARAI